MANVALIHVEPAPAEHIRKTLNTDRHRIENKTDTITDNELFDLDIIFAGGDPDQYLALLRRVRNARPNLPFVVVTRLPETREWLDALEAGATDYCSPPVEARQIQWMMETALPRRHASAAA